MYSLDILLSRFGTVCCSMSSSDCCSLTCIWISQEAGQVVWCSHLFKNFPQFAVIHTVKGFGVVHKEEVDVFLELSCFIDDPTDVGSLISSSSAFSKSNLNIWKFMVQTYCWSLAWRILSITLLHCMQSNCVFPIKHIRSLDLLDWTLESPLKHCHKTRRTLMSPQERKIDWCTPNQLKMKHISPSLNP